MDISSLLFLLLIIGVPVAWAIQVRIIDGIKEKYNLQLAEYKADPTNQEKRLAVIRTCRRYLRWTEGARRRDVVSVELIDMLDDLNAARYSGKKASGPGEPSSGDTIGQRLKTLDDLLDQNLITQEEYLDRRAAILAEI